jgi:hypothetical protein
MKLPDENKYHASFWQSLPEVETMKPGAVLVYSFLFFSCLPAGSICFGKSEDNPARPVLDSHPDPFLHQANFPRWPGIPNLAFDEEFQSYVDGILGDDDRHNVDMAALERVAKLGNGHTRVLDRWLTDNFGARLGFNTTSDRLCLGNRRKPDR